MMVQTISKHYSLDQLGDGVYAAIARDGGAAISNAGLVDLGDCTLVIDTFATASAAEDLRADAVRLTGHSPTRVIDTHYHNDHIWGNQAFLPEADFISTFETRQLIQTAGQEEYDHYQAVTDERLTQLLAQQATLKSRPDARTNSQAKTIELMIGFFSGLQQDFPRLRVILPNIVFDKRMVIYGSKRRVELVDFAGAHTGSDIVVYLPDDGILFMSDLLFVGHHAYIGDGNPDRWQEVLSSILDGSAGMDNVNRFVPGHGPVGTQDDLRRLAAYLRDCQQIAQALVAEGKADQVEASTTSIPEAYSGWMLPMFFYDNLRFLYQQYQGSSDRSDIVKTTQASNSYRP